MSKINLPVRYSQQDARWANNVLGFNTNPVYNFYNYACLITCLAMVAKYYGKGESPVTINNGLKKLGPGAGYQGGTGNYVWGAITKLFSTIKEKVTTTPMPLTDAQMGEIKTSIDKGYPVMVQLDYNPRTVALDQHFVLVVGYDSGDENNLTIIDPLGGGEVSIKKYLGWYRPTVRKTIEKYVVYSGTVSAASKGVVVPSDVFSNVVHGSGEWDKTSTEYLPGRDPKQTNFPEVQRVVNGYKSGVTEIKGELNKAREAQKIAETEVSNLVDKQANKDVECQRTLALKDAEISTLSASSGNIAKLEKQYKGTISVLQTDLREAQKQGGIKETRITTLKSKLEQCEAGEKTLNAFEQVINYIKSIWSKK